MSGDTLFVADYSTDRVLRFTGPFLTPDQVYVASGVFTGVATRSISPCIPTARCSSLISEPSHRPLCDAVFADRPGADLIFAENIGPEPLGVAADRAGRIYIADYRRFRVLIRDEFVRKTPVTADASAKSAVLLATFHTRVNRNVDRVAIGQQLISWEYGAKTNPNAWYGDWLQIEQRGLPLPEIMGGGDERPHELSRVLAQPGCAQRADPARQGRPSGDPRLAPRQSRDGRRFRRAGLHCRDLQNAINDATAVGKALAGRSSTAPPRCCRNSRRRASRSSSGPLHEQNGNFFWWGDNGSTGVAAPRAPTGVGRAVARLGHRTHQGGRG